jgi:flagellar biosynthesis chaperone FliJ
MFWKKEEETFKPEEKESDETEVGESEMKVIMNRLELITRQVNLISEYLSNISQRVSKAMDASIAYQKDLDDLERRIELLRSRIEEIESIPEVELKRKVGRKAG